MSTREWRQFSVIFDVRWPWLWPSLRDPALSLNIFRRQLKTLFCEILTRCTERIRDFFENALYKLTLYLLSFFHLKTGTALTRSLGNVYANFDFFLRFLQGVRIACYAEPCISYGRVVRPSVRPSITHWHWVKTTQATIAKSSPTDSPRTLVYGIKSHPEIRKGSPQARALNESGVGKIRNFQPVSRRISEMVQDRTKVRINDQ